MASGECGRYMRVMTFNILWGGIDKNGSRLESITKTINDESPDFVALQEANDFEKCNNKLLNEVSQHLGLQYYALSPGSTLADGGQYHVASFSRYPFEETHLFSGPQFQCAGLFTVIDSPLGKLAICNVHLHSPMGHAEEKRLKELEIILKHVSRYENQILLGDFNSLSLDDNYDLDTLGVEPRFDVTNRLKRNYVDVASHLKLNDRSTYLTATNRNPAYTKPLRIDYIFVTPSLASYVKDATVIKTPTTEQASDHYPIVATLERSIRQNAS